MIRKASLCVLLTLCLAACVRLPQKGSEGESVEIPERFLANDSLRVAYHYTEGIKVVTLEDDISQALPYFERVLDIDSLHAPTNYQVGEIFYRKDKQKALHHSEIAYKADTTNTEYARMYGYALLDLGEEVKSREIFERLIEMEPRNAENYRIVASLYLWNKMPHTAISILESAESRIGYDYNLSRMKRDLLVSEKLYERAIEEALAAEAHNPRDTEILLDISRLYKAMGRPNDAKIYLQKCLALDPTNVVVQVLLIDLYEQEGNESEKLNTLKGLMLNPNLDGATKAKLYNDEIEALGIDYISDHFFVVNSIVELLHIKHPDNYEIAQIYARHKFRMGERELALTEFERMVEQFPDQKDSYSWVYELHWVLGEHDEAFRALNKAIERFPEDESFSLRKAYWLHEIGAPQKEVERVVMGAIKRTTDPEKKSSLYTSLGDFQQDPNKAFRNYKKALQHNPDNSSALNNWAYFSAINGGNLEEALRMSTRACEITPNNPTYIDTKAWILFLLGNTTEAKRLMRQAISLDTTGDNTLLLHYGDILAAEGEIFMAEHYYKRALDAGEDAEIVAKRVAELHKNNTK